MPKLPKTALVTGAAKGIGRGIVLALAGQGFDVVVHYQHSQAEAETVCLEAQALGVQAVALQANITDAAQAAHLVQHSAETLGSLGVLVNNVGNYRKGTPLEMPLEDWHEMLSSNLHAVLYTCKSAVPLMRTQGAGRIVNLGYAGVGAQVARGVTTAYVIAKTGASLLTKSLAKSEAAHGITANTVAPGVIENSESKPLQEIPMGRLGTIEDVANAVLFFINNPYVTGQTLEVAGAWNL